jgi:hypothetical protein
MGVKNPLQRVNGHAGYIHNFLAMQKLIDLLIGV